MAGSSGEGWRVDEDNQELPNHELWQRARALAAASRPTFRRPIKKIMCANRGEIAIRVFRAAHELGLQTLAIYSYEDRMSLHRFRADESYMVGEGKAPVAAYLDIDDVIRVALENNVDAIHPGYGFLAESSEFARRCKDAGIIFVGPRAEVIELLGAKTSARDIAVAASVPVVPGTQGACGSVEEAKEFAEKVGLPVLLKAAYGGGGRGIRVIREMSEIDTAFERCQSEALASFGNGSLFLEKFVEKPRHVEVQIVSDEHGSIVHLFERDCSIQRRYQKVVEVAPALSVPEAVRAALHADALKIGRLANYTNAGTCEFLVAQDNKHYFIEVNPRIQVEHTITEEITGHDIVRAQICIAAGVTLQELGLVQDNISYRGCSIQLRITTEDPLLNFQPDTGRLEVYRSSGGVGIRLDSSCSAGSVVTAHYDSLLVKLVVTDLSFEQTVIRALRALTEFRIRGIKTNIGFLQRLLTHETFFRNTGGIHTGFIDDTPEVLQYSTSLDRASKLLNFLGNAVVNGLDLPVKATDLPRPPPVPSVSASGDHNAPLTGWRDVLLKQGPKGFAKAVRDHSGLLLMDTTWRDAHQSLLATRVRTQDIARIAPATAVAMASCYSLECWGGATFDVSLRFLHECPWKRLDTLRALVPNIPFQMLIRAANAVGYTTYPDNVVFEFVQKAKDHGIDIFRVFDSLNYIENMKLGIEAVHRAGGVVEACICYSGDVSNPDLTKYTLEYYLDLTRQLIALDIHVLAIKDMAGLLKPKAATMLVSAIRDEFPNLAIHVHTHDTAGTGVASMLACAEAGADVVDVASDCMSGLTSQPSLGAIVGSVAGTKLDTGVDAKLAIRVNDYWELVRKMYAPFESPSLRSGSSDVYLHEMPGGQYTNLQYQAFKLGLGEKWPAVKEAYRAANQLLGDIVKVTPSSKVVGDLAQFLVQNNLDEASFRAQAKSLSPPQSVVQFLQGFIGQPFGGFPEPLRSDIVRNLPRVDGRPGKDLAPLDLGKLRLELEQKHGVPISDVDVLSAALFPAVFDSFCEFRASNGDISVLPTNLVLEPLKVGQEVSFELQKGLCVYVKLMALGQLQANGFRDVFWEVNGHARAVRVRDRLAEVDVSQRREQADANDEGSVGAPMGGVVVDVRVQKNGVVKTGDPLAVLTAMKMETVVSAPVSGTIRRVSVAVGDSLAAGDLIVTIEAASS